MVLTVSACGLSPAAGSRLAPRADHFRCKSHSCLYPWSQSSSQQSTEAKRSPTHFRSHSSDALFLSIDETLLIDPSAERIVHRDIRPPLTNVFKIHKKPVPATDESVWIMREDLCCDQSLFEEQVTLLSSSSPLPLTPPPPPLQFSSSVSKKSVSCKSVSISISGLMTSPGDGFDNFEANEDHLVKVVEKPVLNYSPRVDEANSALNDIQAVHTSESDKTSSRLAARGGCRRYQKPLAVSLFAVGLVMIMTLTVLYWNYFETINRRSTKKQSIILDHWGKGSSSSSQDPDAEILNEKMSRTLSNTDSSKDPSVTKTLTLNDFVTLSQQM